MSEGTSWLQQNGFEINKGFDNGIALVSIIQISLLLVIYTLTLAFKELVKTELLNILQTFSLVFYLLEIGYNCITVKTHAGRKITKY